jgi:hypothetical protein
MPLFQNIFYLLVVSSKERRPRACGILFGWQLLGAFGDLVTIFCLEEIVLMFLLFLIISCILLGCGL